MFSSISDTMAVILYFGQYLESAFKVQARALFGHIGLLAIRMQIFVFQLISFLGKLIPKLNYGKLAIALKYVGTVRSEFPNFSGLSMGRTGKKGWFCGGAVTCAYIHLLLGEWGQERLRCSCEWGQDRPWHLHEWDSVRSGAPASHSLGPVANRPWTGNEPWSTGWGPLC